MRQFLALVAVALLGADVPPSSAPITYEIKYLEMKGLEWRSTLHPRLEPVSRHDAVTVWTSTREGSSEIARIASKTIATPKIAANAMTRATYQTSKTQKVVTEMARVADGPVNHASYVAFAPRVEDETDGCFIAITGRMLEQGVLAQVKIEDKQVIRVHTLTLSEKLEGKDAKTVSPTLHIPECSRNEIAGEWLIPTGGVLVISTGVHTSADDDGKAVVLERLAVVSAKLAEKSPQPNIGFVDPINVDRPIDLPIGATIDMPGFRALNNPPRFANALVPMPAPATPSRSIPEPFDANGEPVPLPPLPDDAAMPVTMLPGSSDVCATPQQNPPDAPMPIRRSALYDRESKQAGFEDHECCAGDPANCPALNAQGATTAPEKPLLFRMPLGGRTTLEVRGAVSTKPFAQQNTPEGALPSR
jgi:hypothetical protein